MVSAISGITGRGGACTLLVIAELVGVRLLLVSGASGVVVLSGLVVGLLLKIRGHG